MGVRTPSRFMGLNHLKAIRENNYTSPNCQIDYSAEEVDALIIEKSVRRAERETAAFERSLLKPKEITMAKVVDIGDKLAKKAKAKSRLVCPHCDHTVTSEDEWDIGIDVAGTKRKPAIRDSGIYFCPDTDLESGDGGCGEPLPYTMLDGMVSWDNETGLNVPKAAIEYFIQHAPPGCDLMSAAMNAVKAQVLESFGPLSVVFWPADREEIEAQFGEIEEEK